jgi:hypothetical protein
VRRLKAIALLPVFLAVAVFNSVRFRGDREFYAAMDRMADRFQRVIG